ncbi:hypothetical protein, partial [Roseovarius atlanticus]|uniref:hypothetical protein n=1 Tax=Roseovarius atlanticus TaxID=1641875 RepID=UPI001F3BF405
VASKPVAVRRFPACCGTQAELYANFVSAIQSVTLKNRFDNLSQKRGGRFKDLRAPRPTRLPKPMTGRLNNRNAGYRYERGTIVEQVTSVSLSPTSSYRKS